MAASGCGVHEKVAKLSFGSILEPRNRGILLDIIVFVISLILMTIATRLSMDLVRQSEEDLMARTAIGLFFAGVFFLQPLGPLLKRWSFHQRYKFDTNSAAGCFLFGFMWFYIVMMLLLSGTATIILTGVLSENGWAAGEFGSLLVLGGFFLSIVNAVFVYRFSYDQKESRDGSS
ncbi:MAG: hypothetical protein ABR501_01390 [Pyrinomonadaceae bacterium]